MYSQFARSRHSGGSAPACQRWEADHSSHEVRKIADCPKLLSSWHHPDKNWVHHTGNSEEVQGHAWGTSSYRAQGLCFKGDLPSTKQQLAHALLDGILFHGAATWPELSEGCLVQLEGVRCRVLRKICQHFRGPDGDGWTDRQVILECDVPRLEVVLAQSRLLLAARMTRNAPDSLEPCCRLRQGRDGSWVQMLCRDIENMRSFLPKLLSSIGSLEEDAQAWNRVWCEHPRAWKGLVQKFTLALDFEK